jgi:hypothetical protein
MRSDLYGQGQYKFARALSNTYQAVTSGRGSGAANRGANTAAGLTDRQRLRPRPDCCSTCGRQQFNANLMLAKIGETNYRLGRVEAASAYLTMSVKKPEHRRQSRQPSDSARLERSDRRNQPEHLGPGGQRRE